MSSLFHLTKLNLGWTKSPTRNQRGRSYCFRHLGLECFQAATVESSLRAERDGAETLGGLRATAPDWGLGLTLAPPSSGARRLGRANVLWTQLEISDVVVFPLAHTPSGPRPLHRGRGGRLITTEATNPPADSEKEPSDLWPLSTQWWVVPSGGAVGRG
jgi:hypothetical protein